MIPEGQSEAAGVLAALADAPVVETHISAVFLAGDRAFKLKKAVDLGFLDFTALTERERLLRRELELNAPHAPGLYRAVHPLTRGEDGALRLGGAGAPVEWVLEMARLPAGAVLDAAEALPPAMLDAMADAAAAMHQAIAPVAGDGDLAPVIAQCETAALETGLPPARVAAWVAGARARLTPALRERAAAGAIRRCHGDLHLGNLCLWEGRPTPFDALEFDERLATIDVGYDLAFLLMDVERLHGRPAANRLLNRYVARTGDAGLVGGLPLWLSLRAVIRAHVEARRGRPWDALLAMAEAYLAPAPPRLIAIGGLPGTGKSTLARALAPDLGPAPGALVLRSDEIRKRRHGVAPEVRLPPDAYTPEASAGVFAELAAMARAAVAAGHAAIADAVFLRPGERARIAAAGSPFDGLWLEAPLDLLRRRVASRTGDASDADIAVLEGAAARDAGDVTWTRLPADGEAEARARVLLDLPPSART
ncbi:MAG: AAA family ATPase [Acetobacteraceae bacterium]|nr:AAA family ATPase [Acetobacteraceae bacterium]